MIEHAVLSKLPYALRDPEGVLCHVTPTKNCDSIIELGISPLFAQQQPGRCWFVNTSKLLWAISHVSAHHEVDVGRLSIFTVDFKQHFLKTGLKGVYCRKVMTMPKRILAVTNIVSAYQESDIYNEV
jgi:hypothetical protein